MNTLCVKVQDGYYSCCLFDKLRTTIFRVKNFDDILLMDIKPDETLLLLYYKDPYINEVSNDRINIFANCEKINLKHVPLFDLLGLSNDNDCLNFLQSILRNKHEIIEVLLEMISLYIEYISQQQIITPDTYLEILSRLEIEKVSYNKGLIGDVGIITMQNHPAFLKMNNQNKIGSSIYSLCCEQFKLGETKKYFKEILTNPIKNIEILSQRYNNIETYATANHMEQTALKNNLSKFVIFKNLLGKLNTGKFENLDFIRLYKNINIANAIVTLYIKITKSPFLALFKDVIIRKLDELAHSISSIIDTKKEGGIRANVNEEYDNIKELYFNLDYYIEYLEGEEIQNLKTRNIAVDDFKLITVPELGYMISVMLYNDNDTVKNENSSVNKSINNSTSDIIERFPPEYEYLFNRGSIYFFKNPITEDLNENIGDLREKLLDFEKTIYIELEKNIMSYQNVLEIIDFLLLHIDCYFGMSQAFLNYGFARPDVIYCNKNIFIAQNVFSVFCKIIEKIYIPQNFATVDPNVSEISDKLEDNSLIAEKRFIFLTGPNGSGKSQFLKSIIMAVYLAHCGLYVPAERLIINLVDSIYFFCSFNHTLDKQESLVKLSLEEFDKALANFSPQSILVLDEFLHNIDSEVNCCFMKSLLEFYDKKFIQTLEDKTNKLFPLLFISTHNLRWLNNENFEKFKYVQFICMKTMIKINDLTFDTINDYEELCTKINETVLNSKNNIQNKKIKIIYLFKLNKGISSQSFGAYLFLQNGILNQTFFNKFIEMEHEEHYKTYIDDIENNILDNFKQGMDSFKDLVFMKL